VTRAEAARRLEVDPSTLRRWETADVVPAAADAGWSDDALAQARVVARLRARGHTLAEIRRATESGRLAFAFIEDLLPSAEQGHTLEDLAEQCDLEVALVERVISPHWASGRASASTTTTCSSCATSLRSWPRASRSSPCSSSYGCAARRSPRWPTPRCASFTSTSTSPFIRDGVPGVEIAEEMEGLARELEPLASPVMDHVHQRFLSHFLEQDVVGHMEAELSGRPSDLGRLRVAIAFADLAGYTRKTEEQGDEEAVDAVERFVESISEVFAARRARDG